MNVTLNDRDKAREIFKAMLDELGVNWKSTWEQALKLIINDYRYNNSIKSTCERKSVFVEWSKQKERKDRDEIRDQKRQAREKFSQLLKQSEIIKDINQYTEAEHLLGKDPRWNSLESSIEREEVFRNYLRDKKREDDEVNKKYRKIKMLELNNYLMTCKWLDSTSEWREVCLRLEDVPEFKNCQKLDRLDVFQDTIRLIEENNKKLEEIDEQNRIRTERKYRDQFKELITAKMRWKEYIQMIKQENILNQLSTNRSGSRPSSLFNDIVEELEFILEKDKEIVIQIMQKN
jgi:pre-mRNA-processing factor 40